MTTMPLRITGGVDTHLDVHVAAALDHRGGLVGVESFDTTAAGYRSLLAWLASFGMVEAVGVEGTGSYGAGLTRHLQGNGIRVVEVDRPNRQRRRRRGKSDPQDAITAARAAQSGDATGEAKTRNGNVEAMRVLRVVRSSARSERVRALNQMRSLISTAPDDLRDELRDLSVFRMLERASAFRPGHRRDVTSLTKLSLRTLARRAISLREEIDEIDVILTELVNETAPALVTHVGVGRRDCLCAPRRRRRQPRTAPERADLRAPVRGRARRRQQRQTRTSPAQPRRRQASELGALADRHHAPLQRPAHEGLPRPPRRRGAHEERGHALLEALRRPRGLQRATPPKSGLTALGASIGASRPLRLSLTSVPLVRPRRTM